MPKSKSLRIGCTPAPSHPIRRFLWHHWRQLIEQVSSSSPITKNLPKLSVQPPFARLGTLKMPYERIAFDCCLSLEYEVTQERLRQARLSFNVALAITTLSAAIGLTGIGLLLWGKVPEGVVTTTAGLTSNLVSRRCLRLTREANDRLDRITSEQFEREQLTDSSTASNEERI